VHRRSILATSILAFPSSLVAFRHIAALGHRLDQDGTA
jgi:hypothetical protein